MAISQIYTADDLLQIPSDGFRYQLVRGELRKMAAAGHHHGHIIMNVAIPLGQYVREHRLGRVYAAETGFILERDPDTVRAPDVAFVVQERVTAAGDSTGFWVGAPDLAVEVTSPSDSYAEVEQKVSAWLEAGARMVIVVNPKRHSVAVYRSPHAVSLLVEGDILDGADVVPGWMLAIDAIFA